MALQPAAGARDLNPRQVEGNRRIGEDGDAQAHRQPQGAAGRSARGE